MADGSDPVGGRQGTMIRVMASGSKALGATRVLLLRHAETSAPACFHGAESDVGLGERGHRQAEAVARHLANQRPGALYSSGMRRAIETARPIARACGLQMQIVPDLYERRMGSLSGRPRDEGWAIYDEARRRWISGDLDHTHPGGESYADIRRRVVPAFLQLAEQSPGQTAVVVAHGVVIRVLLTSLIEGFGPADFDRIAIEFVALNELQSDDGRWRATSLDVRVESPLFTFVFPGI